MWLGVGLLVTVVRGLAGTAWSGMVLLVWSCVIVVAWSGMVTACIIRFVRSMGIIAWCRFTAARCDHIARRLLVEA